MKLVKNKYLVLRALRMQYSAEGGLGYSSTTSELADATGLKEAQTLTAGRALVEEKLAREIQTNQSSKSGNRTQKPVIGFIMTLAGANKLDQLEKKEGEK